MIYDVVTEAKENYPKAYKKAVEFTVKYLKVFQNEFLREEEDNEEDIAEMIPESMAAGAAYGAFAVNQRLLYDFFDENGVYVLPLKVTGGWSYNIMSTPHGGGFEFSPLPSRVAAEDSAFRKAFQVLEDKL
jgi:hypothetical protein